MAILENGICLMHCENLNSEFSSATITNNGATVSTDQHKFGSKSLYFNKNSYVSIGIPSQNNYTIEFWAYPVGDNTGGWYPTLVSSTAHANNGGTYIHIDDGSYSRYPVCRVNSSSNSENTGGYGSAIITRGAWHHIAICKSGNSHYFFLDGTLIKTVNQSNPHSITTWYIGALRGGSGMISGCYYQGYIDEIAISSTCKWTSAFNVPTEAYSASPVYHTVRFLDYNNTVLSEQSIIHNGSATPPNNPSREGYRFIRWEGNYTNITDNVDIIAIYEKIESSITNKIYLGNSNIASVFLGNSAVNKIYLGDILLYGQEEHSTNAPIVCLNTFDATNRKMLDVVGNRDLIITGSETTINNNNLVVPRTSNRQGNITLPMTKLTTFTFSYVVESAWSSNVTQIISGHNASSLYFLLTATAVHIQYSGTNLALFKEYTTAGKDNAKFIDITLDVPNGVFNFYVNGQLKISKTGLSLTQASSNNLYLNNTDERGSMGNFTLYAFKVYNKCLNIDTINENIRLEKERLGWS